MMDKSKLRKADMFSGSIIFIFGLWIISQALKMPMKDSWGGVQNVWFVSPALFPLLVGAMIMLLGALLVRTAIKSVGLKELGPIFRWFCSSELIRFLGKNEVIRFYGVVVLFFCFVYLNIPRIDFFLCSVLFLVVFITMFYFDDALLLRKILLFYLSGSILFIVYFIVGLPDVLAPVLIYPNDWLAATFILAFCIYAWSLVRKSSSLRKKYKTSLILAIVSPFLIGSVFKYFLLVPMPTEGLIVAVMDAIWYFDF